jgi:hypothetical protein
VSGTVCSPIVSSGLSEVVYRKRRNFSEAPGIVTDTGPVVRSAPASQAEPGAAAEVSGTNSRTWMI